jgi:hypothetical protein
MKPSFSIFISKHWDAVLASVAACIFISLFTRHSGIGISPDSVAYLSTATNIREHFLFTDFNGLPLVDFPLGYPIWLAKISFLSGVPVIKIVPALNCILFTGVILFTSLILAGYKKTTPFYKACFLALLVCSPFLLEVYAMLWSETLFLFLIMLFIVALYRYLKTYRLYSLLLVAAIGAVAFVIRYAGICLVATGIFMILLNGEITGSKKIKHLFLFTGISCLLVIVNLVRNNIVSGNLTGVREKALRSLTDNFQQTGAVLAEWLPFLRGHETTATILFILLLLSAITIIAYRSLQQQYFAEYETIVTVFFVIYTVFIIGMATVSRFEDLSSRLLIPLYIPMLLTVGGWMISYTQKFYGIKKTVVIALLLILYAGFHFNHYRLNAEAWEGIKDAGMPGYTEDSWTQSPAVAFVNKNKALYKDPVYANANDAVYFLTGIHALPLPHKEIEKEKAAFLKHESFYLIWFHDGDNPDLVNLDYIRQHKKQISVEELEGGAVYFFADSTIAFPPR